MLQMPHCGRELIDRQAYLRFLSRFFLSALVARRVVIPALRRYRGGRRTCPHSLVRHRLRPRARALRQFFYHPTRACSSATASGAGILRALFRACSQAFHSVGMIAPSSSAGWRPGGAPALAGFSAMRLGLFPQPWVQAWSLRRGSGVQALALAPLLQQAARFSLPAYATNIDVGSVHQRRSCL